MTEAKRRKTVDQKRPFQEKPKTTVLDPDSGKLIAALTLAASDKLGADTACIDLHDKLRKWRTARVLDLTIIDQAADETGPRCINVYFQLEAHQMGLGKRLKIAPDRLLYAVRWLHKGEPPDLDLTLAPPFQRTPEIWFPYVRMALLGRLMQADPSLRDRLAAVAASP